MADIIHYAQGDSALGTLVAAMSARGLAMVEFGVISAALLDGLRGRFPEADLVEDPASLAGTLGRLAGLIEHPEATADLPLDMRGSGFELRVWNALCRIPAGRTITYGGLAATIGAPGEARAVAEACAANTLALVVPCHRVIKKGGSISGYRWGYWRKRALIEREHRAVALTA